MKKDKRKKKNPKKNLYCHAVSIYAVVNADLPGNSIDPSPPRLIRRGGKFVDKFVQFVFNSSEGPVLRV